MQTVVKEVLPQKTRWSQRAVARQMCCDKSTVKVYAETIAVVVPDYLKECPRNSDGSIQSGFSLNQYQYWVVCQLIKLARTIKADLNGTPYRKVVKATAIKMSHALSRDSFERESSSQVA
jgi:hypothetical protein